MAEENNQKEASPDTEKLAKLVFHLSHIVELWREDRNTLIKGFTRHEELLGKLSEQLIELKRLEKSIASTLSESIAEAFSRIMTKVGEAVAQGATKEAEHVIKGLEKSVNQTKQYLAHHQVNVLAEAKKNHWKVLIMTVIASLGGSLLIAWYLLTRSAVIMDKTMMNTYYSGVLLQEVWPTLSKAEKRHIEGFTPTSADTKNTGTSRNSSNADNAEGNEDR